MQVIDIAAWPHGVCECPEHDAPGPCHGPASFVVERDGKTSKVCSRCTLPEDTGRVLLVSDAEWERHRELLVDYDNWTSFTIGLRLMLGEPLEER